MSRLVSFKWRRPPSAVTLSEMTVPLGGTDRPGTVRSTAGGTRLLAAPARRLAGWGGFFVLVLSVAMTSCGGDGKTVALVPRATSTTTAADPMTATDSAVIDAWRAAQSAFYQAEANPRGLFSPALDQTMVNPELLLVKRNLAGNEHAGMVGEGPWDLGTPRVVQLGLSEAAPTSAVVVSCIHDSQVLVNQKTGQKASGLLGETGWIGARSTMTLSGGGWKLSQQSATINTNRTVACAGI